MADSDTLPQDRKLYFLLRNLHLIIPWRSEDRYTQMIEYSNTSSSVDVVVRYFSLIAFGHLSP